jgi:hypothetical protein
VDESVAAGARCVQEEMRPRDKKRGEIHRARGKFSSVIDSASVQARATNTRDTHDNSE